MGNEVIDCEEDGENEGSGRGETISGQIAGDVGEVGNVGEV